MESEHLRTERIRAAAVAVGGVEQLILRRFALVLENGGFQHQHSVGVVDLTAAFAVAAVKQSELIPQPPCIGNE